MSASSPNAWRQPRVATAIAAVIGLIVGVALAIALGGLPWRDYVRRQSPAVVALAFVNPAMLPTTTGPNRTVRFSFTIENRQQRALRTGLSASVSEPATNVIRTLNRGSTVVAAGVTERLSQQLSIPPDRSGGRYEVTVRLDTGQSIDFYVTAPPSVPVKAVRPAKSGLARRAAVE